MVIHHAAGGTSIRQARKKTHFLQGPMFRRMFEKVTLPFLEDHPQLQLLPAQTGFQKHKSTAINITLLQADLQDKEVRTVLIDMADCYDRLSFAYQLKVWKQRKLEPYLITLMTSLVHREMTTRVLVEGQLSNPICRRRGVPQGSVWSPFLYNVAANELVRLVQRRNRALPHSLPRPIGMYADDTTLQARTDDNLEGLVDALLEWCNEAGMKIAWQKCAALGCDRDIQAADGNVIPVSESARYLGLPFRVDHRVRGVDWSQYYNSLIPRITRQTNFVRAVASSWHPGHRLTVVRTFLRPVIEYMGGLFFWTTLLDTGITRAARCRRATFGTWSTLFQKKENRYGDAWRELDAIWKTWMTFVLGTRQARPSAASMTGIEPPSLRFVELGLLLWAQLRNIPAAPGLEGALRTLRIAHWERPAEVNVTEIKNSIRRKRVGRLETRYGMCAAKITAPQRTASGVDRVFHVLDKALCTALLRWREARWGYKRFTRCVCGADFHFAHFRSCDKVEPTVTAAGVERYLSESNIPERNLASLFTQWETQLEAVPGQAPDTSQHQPSSKKEKKHSMTLQRNKATLRRRQTITAPKPDNDDALFFSCEENDASPPVDFDTAGESDSSREINLEVDVIR